MENGLISDGQLSVSSQWSALHGATRARLHIKSPPACWAALRKDANQWLQIDVLGLDRKYTKVTRVATQGRYDCCDQWVTKYKLQYSNDGKNFQYYKEQGQNTDKVKCPSTPNKIKLYSTAMLSSPCLLLLLPFYLAFPVQLF